MPFQVVSFCKITYRDVFTVDKAIFSLLPISSYAKDFVGRCCYSSNEKIISRKTKQTTTT